jgi:hypothetical protein
MQPPLLGIVVNDHGKLSIVTVRKQVDEPTRIAIAKQIRDLLDSRDALGKKRFTQASLGTLLNVSQEAARRAREPDGVTPAIVKGMLAHFGSIDQGRAAWDAEYHRMTAEIRLRKGLFSDDDAGRQDEATAELIRMGVGLREAQDAIRAVKEFKHDEPLDPKDWATIAKSFVIAVQKHKAVAAAPSRPHPKKPPKVGR